MIEVMAAPKSLAGVSFSWNEPTSLLGSPEPAPAEPALPGLVGLSLDPQAANASAQIGNRNAEVWTSQWLGNFTKQLCDVLVKIDQIPETFFQPGIFRAWSRLGSANSR